MDKMELENAIKKIFLQCLNEPDLLEMVKYKLNYSGNACSYEENQIRQPRASLNENNSAINTILMEKIDEILNHQKKIEDMIKSGNTRETETEISAKLKNCQEQDNHLTVDNEELKKENARLTIENREMEEKYRIEISKYSIFEESLDVWNCINELNHDNKGYIESLCGGSNILAILSLGRDDGKIEQLWLYLRDMAVRNNAENDVLKLKKYFEFCLRVANSTKVENEKYVMLDIEPKSEFDMNTCIRTSDSRQIGSIRDIVVGGVQIGKEIKYKAIVRVD